MVQIFNSGKKSSGKASNGKNRHGKNSRAKDGRAKNGRGKTKPSVNNNAPLNNKTQVVTVTDLDHEGKGVVKGEKVTFVQGAIAGETCKIHDIQAVKGVQQAKVLEVLEPSIHRKPPFCPHFSECGGCQTQHIEPQWLLSAKQQAISGALLKNPNIEMSVLPWQETICSPQKSYRRKTRLAIDARNNKDIKLGFRNQNNEVFSLIECQVLTSNLQTLLKPLQSLVTQLKSNKSLGHIIMFDAGFMVGDSLVVDDDFTVEKDLEVASHANDNLPEGHSASYLKSQACPLLTFRFTQTPAPQDLELMTVFCKENNCKIQLELSEGRLYSIDETRGLLMAAKQKSGYVLQGVGFKPGIHLTVAANDFVQINDKINQQMVQQSIDWLQLSDTDRVLDLFCGVGNFSLPIAQHCAHVVGFEGVPEMVQNAQQNARLNGIDNVSFVVGDLNDEKILAELKKLDCNKVILDPARAGAFKAIESLKSISPELILYVSCNPATFGRDIATLLKKGVKTTENKHYKSQYQLIKMSLMDMFPNTSHSEIMGLFKLNV